MDGKVQEADLLFSTVRISEGEKFLGTGFAIYRNEPPTYTYIVTCAHVLKDTKGSGQKVDIVKINSKYGEAEARVIAFGSPKDIDVAILCVEGLHHIPLLLPSTSVIHDKPVRISGTHPITEEKSPISETLEGRLGNHSYLGNWILSWTIELSKKVSAGYSGSPAIDQEGRVFGVTSISLNGEECIALSISSLKELNIGDEEQKHISFIEFIKQLPDLKGSYEYISDELEKKVLRSKERAPLLEELMAIITELKVPENTVKDSYDKCVPDDPLYIEKWDYPGQIIEALEKLNDMPMGKNDIPKLMHFVKILVHRYTERSQKLEEWLEKNATEWKVTPNEVRKSLDTEPDRSFQKEERATLSLLFKLELYKQRKGRVKRQFYVKNVWLHRETGDVIPLSFSKAPNLLKDTYSDDTIYKVLDNVVGYINGYIKQSSSINTDTVEPRFEFFLPFEMFDLEVDRWKWGYDKVTELGFDYPVVIRPLERLKHGENKFSLESKWLKMQRNGTIQDKHIHWIHNFDDCSHMRASANLANTDICVCISLVSPFVDAGGNRRNKPELFSSLFQAGTPVALWFKSHRPIYEGVKQSVKQLLVEGPLADLPGRVKEQRQMGWGGDDENHIGRYLALLWDDPDRFPLEEEEPQLQEIQED